MAEIFVSYRNEDRPRVAPLVDALRGAGLDTWWDQDIPPGGEWRATIERELDAARLVVVAWSGASTGPAGRYVREEAERAAARGAYLGVLIDPVLPPFGFGEWQAIDLSGGADAAGLARFAGQVRARLAGGPALRRDAPPARDGRRRLAPAWLAAGLVGLGLAGFAAWRLWPSPEPPLSPTAFVNAELAGADCAWIQIASVTPGEGGGEQLALAGIAAAPEAMRTRILRAATARGAGLAELDVADVATAPQGTCEELEFMRRFRWPGRSRLTIVPPRGELTRTRYGWTGRFEFETDFARLPPHSLLLGLDSVGGVEVLLPDLPGFRRAQPPLRANGPIAAYEGYFFDENREARNVGLILMTARAPVDPALVGAIGRRSDRAFLDRLDRTAAAQDWQFELALVRCGFESGAGRRC